MRKSASEGWAEFVKDMRDKTTPTLGRSLALIVDNRPRLVLGVIVGLRATNACGLGLHFPLLSALAVFFSPSLAPLAPFS